MKTIMISLLMLFSYMFLLGHQQEMHQHITRESFQLLKYSFPEDFSGLDEMEAYLGYSETDNTQEDAVLFNSVGALKLVAGSWFEDEYDMVYHYGTYRVPNYNNVPPWFEELIFSDEYNQAAHTTITHFWNADQGEEASTHLEDTIEYGEFTLDWEFTISKNALKKIRKYINGNYEARWIYSEPVDWEEYDDCLANDFNLPALFDLYQGNGSLQAVSCLLDGEEDWLDVTSPVFDFPASTRKGFVYNILGRICHLLQDMSVPAHAHCTSHAGIYGMYSDIFESNEMIYFNEIENWNAAEVYDQFGAFIDPYVHDDPVFYLTYFLNQIADFFPDGKESGDAEYDNSIPGLEDVISNLENDLQPGELNSENCIIMYNQLIPYAIKVTAGMLYWFAVESGQIEPVPDPWYVSGEVNTSDQVTPENVTIHFDKLNSQRDFIINADNNGCFSHLFHYRDAGLYNIEVRKDGYYPAVFSNIEIYQELSLGEISLEPIYSPHYVLVSQDPEMAAYHNLKDAIAYLQKHGGGAIYLQPGIYSGEKNRNLNWLPMNTSDPTAECHIKIQALEPHTVIIDCENLAPAFVFDDQEVNFNFNHSDEILGLTIRHAPQAIKIINGSPRIAHNIIENCTTNPSSENTHGAGLYCLSNALIENNIFQDNNGNWNGDNTATYTYGGGIYINNNTTDPAIIRNNQIISCSAQEGGAIYCEGSGPVEISGNLIKANTLHSGEGYYNYPGDCEGIFCSNCENLLILNNTIVQNQISEINGGCALLLGNSNNVMIRNNTISNNHQLIGIKLVNTTNCELLNNIITNNKFGVYSWSGPDPNIAYCNIWNNYVNDLSGIDQTEIEYVSFDPCFRDSAAGDYALEWSQSVMSPCIDRGSPLFTDLDGTPSDLGSQVACWHDHQITELGNNGPGKRYRWISFPVLDRAITEGATDPRNLMQDLIEQGIDEIRILSQSEELTWNNGEWNGGIEEFNSAQGYMVKVTTECQLPISGFRLESETEINLQADLQNWVGYFLEEPEEIITALASIWDKLISVASEDWYFEKNGLYPAELCSLIPGKMYMIEVSESCHLTYTQSGGNIIPRERIITQNFSYDESPEYAAFVIESVNDPDVSEIGLFLNEQCIGAVVVEEFPLELLAFLPENSREDQELNFSFCTSTRDFKQPQDVLYKTGIYAAYENMPPQLEAGLMVAVKFSDNTNPVFDFGLTGNHPNPFNPQTMIEYSIAQKSKVQLQIYNLKGQPVKQLVNSIHDPGCYKIQWDGKDDLNNEVSSGIYFYRLISGKYSNTRKMIMLK